MCPPFKHLHFFLVFLKVGPPVQLLNHRLSVIFTLPCLKKTKTAATSLSMKCDAFPGGRMENRAMC